MRALLILTSICLCGLVTGCDNAATSSSGQESTTASRQADARTNPAELNRSLEEFARTLAMSLGDVQVRQAIHQGVNERFDGAPNILVKDIQNRTVGGSTFRGALTASVARTASVSTGRATETVSRLASVSPQLQIAVPVHADEWDAASYTPLVAAAPYGIAEKDIRQVKAWDVNGNLVLLDGQIAPAQARDRRLTERAD